VTPAVVRPGAWELPLLLHVAGAMVLVGAIVAVLALSAASLRGREGAAALTRLAFRVLLLAALPAFVVMRVGAEWVASEAQWGEPTWIGIGYATSDGGLLLIVIATVLAWRGTRRGDAGPGRLGTAVVGLSALLLLALTVTIWAMTTKPA
jgi:hypothetical protein